jgi:hypothetical protein
MVVLMATVETKLGRLTTLVGVGYFFVWAMLGLRVQRPVSRCKCSG